MLFGGMIVFCLVVEVLIDSDKESHDTLGIRYLHNQHVLHVQHLGNTSLPMNQWGGGKVM